MEEAVKKAFRLGFEEREYLLCFLNGEVVSTRIIDFALDVSRYPVHQLEMMWRKLAEAGYEEPHLIRYGIADVNVYGIEEYYEIPYQVTEVENLVKFSIQEVKASENET